MRPRRRRDAGKVGITVYVDPADLAAFDAECDRVMVGRNLALEWAVRNMTEHLRSVGSITPRPRAESIGTETGSRP